MTCRKNFTHKLRSSADPNHTLTTTGIYRQLQSHTDRSRMACLGFVDILHIWDGFCGRSEFKFFSSIHSASCLPLQSYSTHSLKSRTCECVQGWIFLRQRVQIEERYLLSIFGEKYHAYFKRTHSGLPCIP